MGELYLDNFERLSITERPGGHNGDGSGYQQGRPENVFRPGRTMPVPYLWAVPAYDNDDQPESLLSSAC